MSPNAASTGDMAVYVANADSRDISVLAFDPAAVERLVRHGQALRHAGLFEHLVPAADAGDRVLDEVVAQHFVQCIEQRHFLLDELVVARFEHAGVRKFRPA